MRKLTKHLSSKHTAKVLQKVAPKIPKFKLIKFNKHLIIAVNRSDISLKQFRKLRQKDEVFENEITVVASKFLDSNMYDEDVKIFYSYFFFLRNNLNIQVNGKRKILIIILNILSCFSDALIFLSAIACH